MKASNQELIENLVKDLKPGRHWSPRLRAFLWTLFYFSVTLLVMVATGPFRPDFLDQLMQFPRFAVEALSIVGLSVVLTYWCFKSLVPGSHWTKIEKAVFYFSITAFILSLITAFITSHKESMISVGRPYCVEEVFIYGFFGVASLFYYIRKSHFHLSVKQRFLVGVSAGLIPSALMQVACLYTPLHGLLLHYTPSLILGLIAIPLLKLHNRTN